MILRMETLTPMAEHAPTPARRVRSRCHLAAALAMLLLAACGSPEQKQAEHLERGIAFYEEGNDAKAMVELRNVLRINPKNADAIYHVGLIHERAQRWPQAYAAFQAAAQERPEFVAAHLKTGTIALLGNDLPAVTGAAEAIEKITPGHPDALALKGAVALRQNESQAAFELADTALRQDPHNENALSVLAGVLHRLGETERALARIDAFLADRPESAALRLLKINLLEQIGDPDRVRAAYDELIEVDPGNETYRLALANFLQTRNDATGAEAILRQAIDGGLASIRSTAFLVQLIYRNHGFEAAERELRRLLAKDEQDTAARFMLAELYAREQRPDAAEAELERLIELTSDDQVSQDAKAGIAQLHLAADDLDGARARAREVLAENGEHRGANLVSGLVALREARYDEAIRHARTALRRDPTWLPGLRLVSDAHLRNGEEDLAIGALDEIVSLAPDDAQAAQALATLLTRRGDYDSALKIWDLVLQRSGDKGQALRSRAQIAIRQRNWNAAQTDIESLLELPEQQVVGALLAGDLMIAQNRFDQSREWFEKAQTMAPDAAEPIIGVVRSYLAQNDVEAAITFLLGHTAEHPEDPIAFNLIGELAARQGQIDDARAAFTRAIDLQPEWAAPRQRMATTLLQAGDMTGAVEVLQEAVTAIPDNGELTVQLANTLTLAKRELEAIEVYERIVAGNAGTDVVINNLTALIADHQYEDAQRLQRALDLAARFRTSTNGFFLDTLGWLHYRKGEYAVAAAYLERAVNLETERPDLRYHLGMALYHSGQKERAAIELRRAAVEGADYQGIEEAKATLVQLEAEQQPGGGSNAAARDTSG
jgi:cellulose synthase operon protein C